MQWRILPTIWVSYVKYPCFYGTRIYLPIILVYDVICNVDLLVPDFGVIYKLISYGALLYFTVCKRLKSNFSSSLEIICGFCLKIGWNPFIVEENLPM